MPKFRKKQVVVEAVQWNGVAFGLPLPQWLWDATLDGVVSRGIDEDRDSLYIKTLEGTHRANPYDWIIQGVKGELYPCKPDIFDETYELVE